MPRFLAALTPWLVVVILFIVGYSLDNSCIIPAVWSVEPSLITMISYSLCEISCCNADNTHFLICFSALYAGIMIEIFMALIIICLKKDDIISIHIRKCIDHIYEDLNADLSTKGLADFTKLNVSYLSKLFKQETGQTIKSYVTAAKMDTAQNLLKYSNLSYFEISASLGYSSQSAFTYAFRKFTGITPKKYREKNYEANNYIEDNNLF